VLKSDRFGMENIYININNSKYGKLLKSDRFGMENVELDLIEYAYNLLKSDRFGMEKSINKFACPCIGC